MFTDHYRTVCGNIAHNLVTLRKRNGLSQRAMAQILGISPYSLRVMEKGERLPNVYVDFLFRLVKEFHVNVDDFFESKL